MGKVIKSGQGSRVTALAFFSWGIIMLSRTAFGYYLTELSLNAVQAGLANFLTSTCLFFSAIFFSRLLEKYGYHHLILALELLISAVSVAVLGIVRSFSGVLLVKALLGIGCGPLFALLMTMVERSSTPERYPSNAAIVANGESVINTMCGPVLIVLGLNVLGFRATNLLLALVLALLAFLWSNFTVASPSTGSNGSTLPNLKTSLWTLLQQRSILVCTVGGIFSMIPCWCIYVYVPTLLQATGRYNDTVTSFIMTAMGVFMMIWMLTMPVLCRHLNTKAAAALLSLTAVIALLSLALFPENLLCVLLFILFGGNCSVVSMIFMAILPVESVEEEQSSAAMALVNGSAELLGASIGPLIAGVISDSAGMQAGMLFAAACMAIALTVGLFQKTATQSSMSA